MLKKRWIILSLFILIIIGGCKEKIDTSASSSLNRGDTNKNGMRPTLIELPRVGYIAPDFVLTDIYNQEISLSQYRGKVVFITFWATWCGPCRAEMPLLEVLHNRLKDKGLEILAISSDFEGEEVVRPFMEELGLTYPGLIDHDFVVNDRYNVTSIPTSFLIDRNGMITNKFIGARDWRRSEYNDLIVKLINSKY